MGFSTLTITLPVNIDSFISSFFDLYAFYFISLPCCAAQDFQHNTGEEVKSGCSCFVSNLREKAVSLRPLSLMFVIGFYVAFLHQVK